MQVIGTAGHVDHGKSALVERLTGIDPDRFAEEKRRGLTIDLGFAWLRLPSGREVGLIDVPGHERFIKNMLAGAGGISVCMFVVAANEGWMPQSAEHLAIVDVLGIGSGAVALTKSDTVDEETLALAAEEVEEHLQLSTLERAPVVACSALTGAGLPELVAALDGAVASAPPPPDRSRPRLWIDRVFTISGAGTVATGTLAGGSFTVGDEVELAPEGRRARIRAIQSHRKKLETAGPGNRVALNLSGLERTGAVRGDAVVSPGLWPPTTLIDARITVLPQSITGREHVLTEKGAHLLYTGSAETPVALKLLDRRRIGPGESGLAQLRLRRPLPLARGDRFVLRDAGRVLTYGGGEVIDLPRRPARRNDDERVALLQSLAEAEGAEALAAIVESEGMVDARAALLRAGATEISGVIQLGTTLVAKERLEALVDEIRRVLRTHHESRPLERGMAREAVRAKLGLSPEAFDNLVSRLADVAEEGPLLRLASHVVALDPVQQRARDALISRIDQAGFSPPPAGDLVADSALLRALAETDDLVRIGDFYLTKQRAQEARAAVRAHIESKGPITVAEIRDLLGTSRKYAVPLCEWLDATGATRRRGDVRVLGPTA